MTLEQLEQHDPTETIENPEVEIVESHSPSNEMSEADKQQRLTVLAEDTRTRMKRFLEDIYYIGLNLLEAQEILGHGEFLTWIQAEFEMSRSTAYNFINVARIFKDKLPNFGNLEIAVSTLYQLASPNAEEARAEVLALAEAGEVVSTNKAREIIEKHKPNGSLPPDDDSQTQKQNSSDTSLPPDISFSQQTHTPLLSDFTFRESDHIDKLRHTSVVDVDNRPGVQGGVIPKPAAKKENSEQEKIAVLLEALKGKQDEVEQLKGELFHLKTELETVQKKLDAVELDLDDFREWTGPQLEKKDAFEEEVKRLTSENERLKEKLATLTPTELNRNELTCKELGKHLGVSDNTINNWEKNGKLEKRGWRRIPGTGGRGNTNPLLYCKI